MRKKLKRNLARLLVFVVLFFDWLIQNFDNFGYKVANMGVSFGLFPGLNVSLQILLVFGLILLYFKISKKYRFCLEMLLAGGLVNLFSRLRFGYVVDYIQIPMISTIFNLSDVVIVLGLIYCVYLAYET